MRRAAIPLLLLALACSPGPPIPDRDLTEVNPGADEIELGRGFPLEVVRAWSKGTEPPTFREESLAPLRLVPLDKVTREDDRRMEERRRYRAYAFTLTDLPGLRVTPALDPDDPGPAELPPGPLSRSTPPGLLVGLALAAAAALALFFLHRRRSAAVAAPAAPPEPPPPSPDERALAAFGALRDRAPDTSRWYLEATGILRAYLIERFRVRAAEMTTEEAIGAPLGIEDEDRALLAEFLVHADLVKFARHRPDDRERDAMLAVAERFVRRTA